jgi:hypothetical protein
MEIAVTIYNIFVVISGGPGFRGSESNLSKDDLVRWLQGFPAGLKQTTAYAELDNRTAMQLSLSITTGNTGGLVIEVEPICGYTKYDFMTSFEMTVPAIVSAIRGLSD